MTIFNFCILSILTLLVQIPVSAGEPPSDSKGACPALFIEDVKAGLINEEAIESRLKERIQGNVGVISESDQLREDLQELIETLIHTGHGALALSYLRAYGTQLDKWFYDASYWTARFLVQEDLEQLEAEVDIETRLFFLAAFVIERCVNRGSIPEEAIFEVRRTLYFLPHLARVLPGSSFATDELWTSFRDLFVRSQEVFDSIAKSTIQLDKLIDCPRLQDAYETHWFQDAEEALQKHYGVYELDRYRTAHRLRGGGS